MEIIDKIKYLRTSLLRHIQIYNVFKNNNYKKERLLGEIIRNTHSIEKGLSLENVRWGFGQAKINKALQFINEYVKIGGNKNDEIVLMFIDSLHSYICFHKENNKLDKIQNVISIYEGLCQNIKSHDYVNGGYKTIIKTVLNDMELASVEKLFNSRHSVREYDTTPIDEEKLQNALNLAMRCPSACNRQAYRCHIINKNNFDKLNGSFDGVGGFAEDLQKILLITGKMSDYRYTEDLQWIVTGSVFASYLTLTLQAYGIGCCFIQRPLLPNEKWTSISEQLNIPGDELAVCALGIGNFKDTYKVPVSHRLPYDEIVTVH